MISIDSRFESYRDLIDKLGKEKIQSRYEYLYKLMQGFIDRLSTVVEDCRSKLVINERVLMHSVLEYFEDIEKVKAAHDLDHTNSPKVVAYMSYWLLRRHPLQIIGADDESERLVFANEKFVLTLIMGYLTYGQEACPFSEKQRQIYDAFTNSLYYYLKFRRPDPQALEMIILASRFGVLYPESGNYS